MMQQGQWNNNQMHGMCGCNKMQGQCGCNQMRPSNQMMQPIVCPTQYRCHDTFVRQEVPVIHPIVNVNRQHTVVVPRNYVTESTRTVPGSTVFPQGGRPGYGGPGFGGPGFGGPGFGGPGFGGPGFGGPGFGGPGFGGPGFGGPGFGGPGFGGPGFGGPGFGRGFGR